MVNLLRWQRFAYLFLAGIFLTRCYQSEMSCIYAVVSAHGTGSFPTLRSMNGNSQQHNWCKGHRERIFIFLVTSERSEQSSYWQSYILFDDIQTTLKPLKNRKSSSLQCAKQKNSRCLRTLPRLSNKIRVNFGMS